ncbi:hypothetical protein M378DRAFT_850820 [Amanita muscaria Koide BX008]|uniref:Uncharacterized protein n=1 Tax=Amanita muscaria (strain Koide BX008) TaxID=946122 RepID=A0A0C2WYW9_AMAMK|nr:hypothetical protein M378DRAFT_850820 [Amanita muscaria Koide BX008]
MERIRNEVWTINIYRHPSCLIKHRWEHTPHWREASKYVLSKHQQVQLLEAAAILSHLSPSMNSLPDDRSLWPSFLSGGSLPPPESINFASYSLTAHNNHHEPSSYDTTYSPRQANSVPTLGTNYYRASSSYPNSGSGGPRLHDYPLPDSHTVNGNVTQVRLGLVGVPNTNDSPISTHSRVSAPTSSVLIPTSSHVLSEEEESSSRDHKPLSSPDQERFSSRSISGSRSRSGSTSVSDDDEMSLFTEQEKSWRGFHGRRYANAEDIDEESTWSGRYGRKTRERRGDSGHARNPVTEEWDGMEMDMEMD